MATRIRKWGNSLGVRIPKVLAERLGITAGSAVEFVVRDGKLVLLLTNPLRFDLDDLLSRVTRRNLHREIDTGGPMGQEAW